jgi:indole-3-glycerol phosphate synthase
MVSVLKTVEKLRELISVADDLQMDCLVEIHSEEELEIALKAGAKTIGVNARDFSDLSIDQKIFTELLPKIPGKIIKIAESGMKEKNDILAVSDLADGVLIGTTLMKSGSENIAEKISELFGE